jgi:hypothetical protein
MNNITSVLQGEFKSFAINLAWVMQEAADIDKAYFATDASTLVGALSSGTSAASLDTKLTKAQYVNYIGFVEQLANFFGNSAVTTGDYLTNIDQVIYGNAATPAKLSDATESIANRMKVHAQACLTHFLKAKYLMDLYSNSELSVIVAGCTGARMVYGADMNVTQLTQGITLVEQFKKMINNESVVTGLYSANVAVWEQI